MVRELHPVRDPAAWADHVAIARREVLAAVDLVAGGGAPRVAIVNLTAAEVVAAEGLAAAQVAGVAFRIVRERRGSILIVVGPRLGG